MEETALRRSAKRSATQLAAARRWHVFNPDAKNALGQPTGYLLVPGENSVPYLLRDSPMRQRAGFVNHHFWATKFEPTEMHAAGTYPNQSAPGEGFPNGPRTSAPSNARTSSPGTRSASPTCRAPRSGR